MNSIVAFACRSIAEVSSGDFRSAMRRLTGGVSVITAGQGQGHYRA